LNAAILRRRISNTCAEKSPKTTSKSANDI
jgi:hypothetical protein